MNHPDPDPQRGDPVRDPDLERRLLPAVGAAPVYAYRVLASTMDTAHRWARQGAPEGTLVWAARQTQGRGRFGRTWESPEGGAYFSIILRPSRDIAEAPQLALIAGLATAIALRPRSHHVPSIRWPNDIFLNGGKVAGILIEARDHTVVVGVGVNVNTQERDLPAGATSLADPAAGAPDPFQLTAAIYQEFQRWYAEWTARGFTPIREALRPWMGLFGQFVQLLVGSSRIEGTASDVDECGRLLVRLDSGILHPVEMGEVTVLASPR